MQLRDSENAKPSEITYEHFKTLIARGDIHPHTLVSDNILTDDEWRTADNLRIFQKLSPTKHPPGDHLKKRIAFEQARDAHLRCAWDLQREYMEGSLIEERYGLARLTEVLGANEVHGAARLIFMPSFFPEQIVTVIFGKTGLNLECVRGSKSLWSSLPQATFPPSLSEPLPEPPPFQRDQCVVETGHLTYAQTPELFSSWEAFVSVVRGAVDCTTSMCDGVGYRHRALGSATELDTQWNNPSPETHTEQLRVVAAYKETIQIVGMKGAETWLK